MSYNPSTDFVGLWRAITGGVSKSEMPGLDFVVAALGRAGLISVSVSSTQPVANQVTTAWFQPASPSYSAEGALYLWNATAAAYQPATPALFRTFLENSFGATGASWFTTTAGAPSNTVGNNGDFAIRTDSPGGIYGPKVAGAWPATPLPGTSYSQLSAALDYAFGTPSQGSVVYRGAATWAALAPGVNGQTLTSQGPGANPVWTNLSNTVNSAALDASFGSNVGNILYRASGGWQSLNISGTANSILSNPGGIPGWTTLTGLLDSAMSNARGSVLFRGASGWQALGSGTAGYLLSTNGNAADPAWIAPSIATVNSAALDAAFGSTVGGTLVRGTGGWTNLGAGTSGFFLKAQGAGQPPIWAAQANNYPSAPAVGSYAVGELLDASLNPLPGTWTAVARARASSFGTTTDIYTYQRTA